MVLTGAPMWRAYTGTGNDLDNLISTEGAARQRLFGEGGNDTLRRRRRLRRAEWRGGIGRIPV